MSILAWIVLGLIAGFIRSKIVNKSGDGFFLDIILGIVGAVVGGYIASALGISPQGGLIYTILIAIGGAVLVVMGVAVGYFAADYAARNPACFLARFGMAATMAGIPPG